MKNILFLIAVAITTIAWSSRKSTPTVGQNNDIRSYYLTKVDAEKILGQRATLTDSMSTNKNNVEAYQCTYTADEIDTHTGKLGAVYFMLERYKDPATAKERYHSFKTSNQNSVGFKIINDIGDEAWFHTDDENFCLIIVRKNDKMLRMKVNKLTSKTSPDAFTQIAKVITDRM